MKKKRKKRAKNGTITKPKVWAIFSKYIRLRDADDNGNCTCVTCEATKHWTEMQAGHGIGGRGNDVLFDENIVYAQCQNCNIWHRGEYGKYAILLIKKFGLEWCEERVARSKRVHKLGKTALQEIYEHYTEEVERLKLEKGL